MKAKNQISANQEQLNVVGFLSSFVLVSLSHFSFVSTCVYPGEAVSSHPPPLAFASGLGGSFIYRRRPLHEGVVASSIYSSEVLQQGRCCGTGRAASWWLAVSELVRSKAYRASEGPSGSCPTSADIFLRGHSMSPNSGCLPRQTAGALIVTLLVTIQGTARALKHARAPSRPGTNGGAPVESRDPQAA